MKRGIEQIIEDWKNGVETVFDWKELSEALDFELMLKMDAEPDICMYLSTKKECFFLPDIIPSYQKDPELQLENSCITLPVWLQKYLSSKKQELEQLGGNKDIQEYSYHYGYDIRATKDIRSYVQTLDYLIKYSPRSFTEAYCIVADLYRNWMFRYRYPIIEIPAIRLSYNSWETEYAWGEVINILDVGCGNGFSTIGALTAIIEKSANLKVINLWAFDCCDASIVAFAENLLEFQKYTNVRIVPHFQKVILKPDHVPVDESKNECKISDLYDLINESVSHKLFKFVLCFKMVNELIGTKAKMGVFGDSNHVWDNGKSKDWKRKIYTKMAKKLSPFISSDGCFILADIALDNREKGEKEQTIFSKELRNGIWHFLQKFSYGKYQLLTPVPCSLYKWRVCDPSRCQPQRRFQYSGGVEGHPYETISYYIIAKSQMVDLILGNQREAKYQIREKIGNLTEGMQYCSVQSECQNIVNGFNIEDQVRKPEITHNIPSWMEEECL